MRYYVSWKDGKPALLEGEYGTETPDTTLRFHLKACHAKRDKARARLDAAEQELRDMQALASKYGVG